MRQLTKFYLFFLVGLLVISCQKDTIEPDQLNPNQDQDFTVPDIPDEIAAVMSAQDIAKFKAGPGPDYMGLSEFNNARKTHGHWHPVLMKLGYHLQVVPIGGTSCTPGEFVACFGPGAPADPTECLNSYVGIAGFTYADGYWFRNVVHSEYYPVFCAPDFGGYGEGFYQVTGGMLWLTGEMTPHQYDEDGNMTFYMKGIFQGEKSTGIFEGAVGWEIMKSYTAVEDNPSTDPEGKGYSDVIIFGWVFY